MDSIKEFNCIFCKQTFESKEELQVHFRKHGDPNFNQSTKSKVRPNDTPGEKKTKEVGEMISCDVCPELFPTISKAITHKHKVHPDHDAKYFCPWCGKLFTMKHLYNKHISSNHETTNQRVEYFPCDCCDVTFHVSSAMLYHNKFFHRQDTDLPAIGQSKKLMMINQCSIAIYYCPFCGQEYNNKVNLHKHMNDDHSDENQSPDDVLRCPLCDAVFYHLDAYEHHLSFHSVDDMYSETNEMFESLMEFSLELVPPIMEKVENIVAEPESKKTSEDGAMGLDDLLLMAMGNSVGEDNPKKSKKHKKHKKSKKAAITLDEFLNMNKDVFGEGIDIQGIEEVPSQVVAKRFKVKKKAALQNSGPKMSPKEIEKLRKQGIVIKMKGSTLKKQIPSKVKQMRKNSTNVSQQNNSADVNTSNEVLSKLINQSNNQIKIVRKPAQNNNEISSVDDEKPSSPENVEVECDLIPRYTSSETDGEEKPDNKINRSTANKTLHTDKTKLFDNMNNITVKKTELKTNPKLQTDNNDDDMNEIIRKNTNIHVDEKANDNISLSTLKNVSQHVTVMPVTSSVKNNSIPSKTDVSRDESNDSSAEIKEKGHSEIKETTNGGERKEKPIHALKHLSHSITIKSVNQTKNTNLPSSINRKNSSEDEPNLDNSQLNSDEDDNINDSIMDKQNIQPAIANRINTPEHTQMPMKSLNSFQNISSQITIKPMTKNVQSTESQMSHSSDEDEHNLNTISKHTANKYCNVHPMAIKSHNVVKNPALSPKVNTSGTRLPIKEASLANVEDNTKSQQSVDLLKNLTNVTAKPICSSQNAQLNKCMIPLNQKITQTKNKEDINKEIEIYNIDDSDSDNGDNNPLPKKEIEKQKLSNIKINNSSSKPIDVFKSLGKHLTIKSTHHKNPQVNIKPDPDQEELTDYSEENFETEKSYIEKNKVPVNKSNKILQNTLKNLSKHITIKSRNSSPSSVVTTLGHDIEDSNERLLNINDVDSDNGSDPGPVKITEVDNEHNFPEKQDEFDEEFNDNAIVESPHDSDSDNDDFQKTEEDFEDIESKIHANTLKRIESKHEDTLRNIGKGITIKSLSEKKLQSHAETAATTQDFASLPGNLSKELSIKPFKQVNNFPPDSNVTQQQNKTSPQTINKINKTTGQQIARSTNQTSSQKMCASTNQTNTVNKEVTVKTFQTKTVIQEITTTVTKTIKTVNQTMKQEVQTSNQSCTQNVLRKVQGMRPPVQQLNKNYQGVVVRHAAPIMGTKVRSAVTPVRPARPSAKASNQLVPVRPSIPMNARPHTPRAPIIRSNIPSTSTSTNIKPIKMSPNIVNTSMKKRPTAPETTGPFSCFKKPKESLIPMSDMSGFNSSEDESMISFASSSQMNKSNFMNMTRTMKDNTIVNSTQMKTEFSSCSQQLSKLNNVTGLRIVKTSQTKQASQVEEKQEVNPAKRIAMEAIEKLQKQGLLVKKSRFDTNDEGEFSDDEDGEHFPPDEEDDDFDAE